MTTVTSYGIDRWNVNGKQITLFYQDDETSTKLKYRIEDGQSSPVEIHPHLYSTVDRIYDIVPWFHDVIQANLQHSIEPSSFVPIVESGAWTKRLEQYVPIGHLKVALFGHGDSSTKTLHEAHWGIFNAQDNSTKTVVVQKIEGDLKECLVNVLFNRYHVSFYKDHRIEVSLDSDDQVQSLALTILSRPCSAFDKNVHLDENHWAVTLISTKQDFTQELIHAGHALIACEGVKEGCKFIEYAHVTKKPEKGDTNKSLSGARVEVLKELFSIERNGPTWRRPRSAVENILVLAQKAQQDRQIIPFAIGKNIYKIAFPIASICLVAAAIFAARYDYRTFLAFHSAFYIKDSLMSYMLHRIISMSQTARSFFWSLGFTVRHDGSANSGLGRPLRKAAISLVTASLVGASAYVSKKLSDRSDCLSWAVEQLSKAGVPIQLPLSIITPNGAIEHLNKHSKNIVLKDS
ncbi:MAG TPA: hypothetical protein VFU89_00410 [Rhabdochlamydiaceae bacterium]|nr:hypothetical protein [Rhabdochlamydiaceae bacterium]